MTKVVDITGLMAKANEGWEERVERLARPENFDVTIQVKKELVAQLSGTEIIRLGKKLDLIEGAATYLAAGMLKGTIKYQSDNYSIEQWLAHVVGEGADQFNYNILLHDAFTRYKADDPDGQDAA